ncbi:lipoate--protein ligase family protein [Desulfotomaculum copahuensis]|uniref:BPL/LPL catalytic domain-containing protein n=1 Tax=Desulfotomaculum copahuensis TaxID=1838280 RepID=A0A1B7LIE6_9FIRM|nr:biotin/lipoate A/B protein ligase family protein [Desulfotomaculum copahuensis]OAT86349.1 hypothetical protein A6M21_16795 [Desulfotomaculum copahuensis]
MVLEYPRKWRLLQTGAADGPANMAVDEAIMIHHSRGGVPPTLRFYRWDPPTLSLGYFQEPEREVNREACRRLGVGLVRRPTGGRAVLHDDEVTYSVVIAQKYLPGSVVETYRVLSGGLLAGLRLLGVPAELYSPGNRRPADVHGLKMESPGQPVSPMEAGGHVRLTGEMADEAHAEYDLNVTAAGTYTNRENANPAIGGAGREHESVNPAVGGVRPVNESGNPAGAVPELRRGHLSAACFDAPSWYEVAVAGKKLVGSAQVRRLETILQHGSILIGLDEEKLFSVLAFASEKARERVQRAFAGKATALDRVLPSKPSYEQVCRAMARGFEQALGIELVPGELTAQEQETAAKLKEKYMRL